jgi:anti-sigma B factor antagonist
MPDSPIAIVRSDGTRHGECILRLQGPLTLNTHHPFQTAVKEETASTLLVDLSEVPYVDSAGLGSLVGALVTLQRARKQMVLVGPNQRVRALIQMSNLLSVFPTYATIEEAETGLP